MRTTRSCRARARATPLRAIDVQSFDVLVTDAVMPGISGPDLCLRARARRPGVGVVLMSGYEPELFAGASAMDHVVFLRKPFTRAELLDAMSRAMPETAYAGAPV